MKAGSYLYSLEMRVPIGQRHGKLELNILGEAGDGFLTMFTKRLPISEVNCSGKELRFSGVMETLLYRLPYTAQGTVDSKVVQVVFRTDRGCFPAEGAAIQEERKHE